MDDERQERRNTYLLYLAFVTLLVLVVGTALPHMADGSVREYERRAERDPDGVHLLGMSPRDLGPENPERAILFVHGFSGSPTNYNDLPDFVAADGWRVRCMLLPGHGTSPHEFETTTGDAMLEGVLSELRALKKTHKHVVLVGHSLGGALVTLAAAREPVDALILCAPFFGLEFDEHAPVKLASIADVIAPLVRWLPRPENGEPVAFAPNRKFIHSYKWIPAKAGVTAMALGKRVYDEGAIAKVSCPLLLLHSRGDHVNSFRASERAFQQFSTSDKRFAAFEKSDHIIFWDYDRLQTIDEVRAFLDRHFPATAPSVLEALPKQ